MAKPIVITIKGKDDGATDLFGDITLGIGNIQKTLSPLKVYMGTFSKAFSVALGSIKIALI